jgi:lysophospholipase L1-like esterase
MGRNLARKAPLVGLWTLYLLGLLELTGFLYFRFASNKPVGSYGYPEGLFIAAEGVEYGMAPGFRGTFVGEPYGTIPIDINRAGFRDVEFGQKAPGTLRIAVIGDSVVFGSGVKAGDRFTDLLRGTVLPSGQRLEPLNLGVSSYSLPNYIALAERRLGELHPDAVVVAFTLNDYEPIKMSWPRRLVRKAEPPPEDLPFTTRARRWIRNSHGRRFSREMRDKARFAVAKMFGGEPYHTQWMRNVIEGWSSPAAQERVRRELIRTREILERQRVEALYLPLPELNDVLHPGRFGSPRLTVVRLLRELNLPVCDPYPRFAAAADPASLFLPGDSVHFTAAGHRLAAEELASCLRLTAGDRR